MQYNTEEMIHLNTKFYAKSTRILSKINTMNNVSTAI